MGVVWLAVELRNGVPFVRRSTSMHRSSGQKPTVPRARPPRVARRGRPPRPGARRPGPRKSRRPAEQAAPRRPRVRHLVMLFGLVAVSGVFAAMFGGRSESSAIMPGSLLGVWKTPAPKYAGRFFEISSDIVVFATGDGETAVHPIASVEMVPEGQQRLYTVWYWSDEMGEADRLAFRFYYDTVRELITFKNQEEIIWTNIGRPLSVPELIKAIEGSVGRNGEPVDPDAKAALANAGETLAP